MSVTTNAEPEIAEYHFTTLVPNLGVVMNENGEHSFVLADIPGLIEGAAEGAGLGHEFLRHIERTRLLIHVIDISGSEGRDPFEDFLTINNELQRFNEKLSRRPQIIALNKSDMDTDGGRTVEFKTKFSAWLEENAETVGDSYDKGAWRVFPLMAAISEGTAELMRYTGSVINNFPPEEFEVTGPVFGDETFENDDEFTVTVDEGGVYCVEGRRIRNLRFR